MTHLPTVGRLGVFAVPPAADDPAGSYANVIEAFRVAERLGFHSAWVPEAHISPHIGLPAALSLLAAASQVTDRIQLGTAVIPLAFDHPLRLAQTASVVNALAGDRLELGVGKGNPYGFSTRAFHAFGLDEDDRDRLFTRALEVVRIGLDGIVPAGDGEPAELYPPSQGLPDRIWQATGSAETSSAAGRSSDGLLLYRTTFDGKAGDMQDPLIDSYLAGLGDDARGPRVGVSRGILPAPTRAQALKIAEADLAARQAGHVSVPGQKTYSSVEEYLTDTDVAFGTAEDIVDTLAGDVAFTRATDYLFSLPFAAIGSPEYMAGLKVIASEVHPNLQGRMSPVN